jgi:transposase
MFIREKLKAQRGKKYTQHQLIESVRTPLGPRQKIVYNFGCLELEKKKWKELANRIESKLHNQSHLFVSTREIEKLADHYVKLIIKSRLSEEAEKDEIIEDGEKTSPQYEMVDIDSCSSGDARTIGAEHVVLNQISEYNFDKILAPLGFTDKQISYAKMLISSRLVHPASERETSRWLRESSGLLELLQKDMEVYDNALHRTSSMLFKNHESIEKSLSESARELFSLKENLILYDLTNTYFSGNKRGSQIAKHGGNSKERRNDRPLVTLALTVDEEGFPKQSKILDGNVSEPETLEKILDELVSRQPCNVVK